MKDKGFVGRLFDFSFSSYLTTNVISLLFGLAIVVHAVGVLRWIIAAFGTGVWRGLFTLVISPVVYLLLVLLARVCCELLIVIFKIAENTQAVADALKAESAIPEV